MDWLVGIFILLILFVIAMSLSVRKQRGHRDGGSDSGSHYYGSDISHRRDHDSGSDGWGDGGSDGGGGGGD